MSHISAASPHRPTTHTPVQPPPQPRVDTDADRDRSPAPRSARALDVTA